MNNKRLQIWLPLIFSLVMIAGMFFGFQLHRKTGGDSTFFAAARKSSLEQAMDLIRLRYVDSIGVDSLQDEAIEELMNELDPHSIYIPATDLSDVNEDIIGNFEGIGVEFNVFRDTVHVLYVLPGGPSDKAGLQVGDRIIGVDGNSIASKNLTSDEIKKIIRGEGGSKVTLSIFRNHKASEFTVTRGTIPLPSVDASYMIAPETGYIKINKFSKTTYEEFMQSLEALQKQGMKELIVDLRGNGGGLLDEAVDIADEFLDDNKMIVYTEGVNVRKREYRSKRPGLFETGKLAVLVDELSASASEILAGALQDWDRATIVGRRTFGKGLVQEQYPLSDGSAIRLTVARYYTPLGRSIQRSYEKGKKVYMDEIWERYRNGEMIYADSNKVDLGDSFVTRGGKIVYGGGGIMPDVFVPIDTTGMDLNIGRIYLRNVFNSFVYNYYIKEQDKISQYQTPEDFIANYNNLDEAWKELVQYALRDNIDLKKVPEKDKEQVKRRIKAFLARYRWRTQGLYEVLNADDSVVHAAEVVLAQ